MSLTARYLVRFSFLAMVTSALVSCSSSGPLESADVSGETLSETQAVARLRPTEGSTTTGVVRFQGEANGVRIVADIEGLTADQEHGIHIHEVGDCGASDASSAGGHYNPEEHPHGLTAAKTRHAGDLGNLSSDSAGRAHLELTVDNVSLGGTGNNILGRAVIVHAKPDDGGQPTGNSGARIACGVIVASETPIP